MIGPISFALLFFTPFRALGRFYTTVIQKTPLWYEIKLPRNATWQLVHPGESVPGTTATFNVGASSSATRFSAPSHSERSEESLVTLDSSVVSLPQKDIVWAFFQGFIILLLLFIFIPPIFAEDTRLQALYGGDVRLVAPFREEEEFRIIDGFEPGMREFSVSAGGSLSWEEPRIYTFTLLPKFGWILGTYNKPKGALEFEFEPFISMVKEPAQYSQEVGATIMFAYNFETGTKLVPFVHAGGGAIHSGMNTGGLSHVRDLEKQQGGSISDEDEAKKLLKSRLNAIAQMGFGVKYFFRDRTSFNTEFRWRHISDPSTSDDLGIDSMFFLFGLSYFY